MLVSVVLLMIFAVIVLAIYYPVISQYFDNRKAEGDFMQELELLPVLYESSLFIITDRKGEGPSRNSDVKFEQAHKNQAFAVSSILGLINELEG